MDWHLYPSRYKASGKKVKSKFVWEKVKWGKCHCGLWHSNRHYPSAFWNKKWNLSSRRRVKVGIILLREKKEVWTTQSYHNCFGFPKGEQEKNESLQEGALREFYEETGYKLNPEILKNSKLFTTTIRDIHYNLFLVEVPSSFNIKTFPVDTVEITSFGWLSIEKFENLKLSKAIQKILIQVKNFITII